MYFDYIREKHGTQSIVAGFGFITYSIDDFTKSVYIFDIYVSPEHRKSGKALELCQQVEERAREAGCQWAYATLDLNSFTAREGLALQLKAGMMPFAMGANNLMSLRKELK